MRLSLHPSQPTGLLANKVGARDCPETLNRTVLFASFHDVTLTWHFSLDPHYQHLSLWCVMELCVMLQCFEGVGLQEEGLLLDL